MDEKMDTCTAPGQHGKTRLWMNKQPKLFISLILASGNKNKVATIGLCAKPYLCIAISPGTVLFDHTSKTVVAFL